MERNITALVALLLCQLAIAGLIYIQDTGDFKDKSSLQLIANSDSQLQQLEITDGEQSLTLERAESGWFLQGYPKVKLDQSKVALVTQELLATKLAWPIARSATSHQRFNLADDSFDKRLTFTNSQGEQSVVLFGDSPSFKQLYVRNQDHDEIYNIKFAGYQVTVDADDWLDKHQLAIDSISTIEHSLVSVSKVDEQWQLAGSSILNEQQQIDSQAIEDFVNQLTSLTVSGLATTDLTPTDTLTVVDDTNQQYVFAFSKDEDNYYVQREDTGQWFRLPQYKYEQITKISLDNFISPQQEEETELEKVTE
ncbi:DUF4340 domain-containing protein [Thalassotalea sp. LPB0316]|uniref:DUF4340 domain-containing protein n=1 Tax=Thalassotalea sp. LPB0316 TaxID=2769490 RepID=UPI001868BD70|nr:DUF4340 domain-containing protein [Thalassotalea sp. LPB0316]QOL25083.1 DUF4340 domain-containing protein [Thalassotalea sp. LPB0316]